jgi:hypothetical protein
MDLKHYEQLKPVNEHLAIPAPKGVIDHNNMSKALGLSFDDALDISASTIRAVKDNKNLAPRNAAETILLASKTFRTAAQLASFAYSMGATDATDPDGNTDRAVLMNLLGKISIEDKRKILEDMLAERGHSHGR